MEGYCPLFRCPGAGVEGLCLIRSALFMGSRRDVVVMTRTDDSVPGTPASAKPRRTPSFPAKAE